ncbi:MAG: hypothetical protein ABIJ09_08920 [Pseudomonadota bacterium]
MSVTTDLKRAVRWLSFGLALLLIYPLALALVAAAQTSLSLSSWALLGGLLLIELAALGAPLQRGLLTWSSGLAGAVLLIVTTVPRSCASDAGGMVSVARADAGPERGSVVTPADPPAWLLEERDLVLLAAQMLPGTRWLEPGEAQGLKQGLAAGYDAVLTAPDGLRAGAPTWRARQQAGLVDALVVHSALRSPEIGLIFLHGFGGNFAWPCWAMAHAVRQQVSVTLCPSLGTQGDWWSARGLEVAQQAVEALRARGITRYILAGLSNGALGAGAIASALQPRPERLILISGLPRGEVPAELPVLLVQGDQDRRVSTARARRLAQQHADTWTYLELDGDHFVWLRRPKRVDAALRAWLPASTGNAR